MSLRETWPFSLICQKMSCLHQSCKVVMIAFSKAEVVMIDFSKAEASQSVTECGHEHSINTLLFKKGM